MTAPGNVTRLTDGPRHHFFGFHDLEISSRTKNRVLVLAVDRIDRPPTPKDRAAVCVLNPDDPFTPTEITTTSTYNFPQGARQQWLSEADHFIVNQMGDHGTVGGIYDSTTGQKVAQIDRGCHVMDRQASVSFSIDYGRLHRLGGYGYASVPDASPDEPAPDSNGIFATEVASNKSRLILSIADVVSRNESARTACSDHYFTHLSLNPKGDRLAFLHRYRLPDGGEQTCLMTVGAQGNDCRLLAQGFLSHFDWKDDRTILIWGRKSETASKIRNSSLLQNPMMRSALRLTKNSVRRLIGNNAIMRCSYLLMRDADDPETEEFVPDILRVDGHPMVNPRNRDWLVTDTYPDDDGMRDLMLFRFSDRLRIDLGQFRMLDDKPSAEIVDDVAERVSKEIAVAFPPELYAFTRSGLHCDLHPRWFADGSRVAFDSIHEGSRQLYVIDATPYLS